MVGPDETPRPGTRSVYLDQWIGERAGELNRACGVEKAGALRQRVGAVIAFGRVLQNRLDRVRRQSRVGLQHECDGAGNDRSGHARSSQAEIWLGRSWNSSIEQVL